MRQLSRVAGCFPVDEAQGEHGEDQRARANLLPIEIQIGQQQPVGDDAEQQHAKHGAADVRPPERAERRADEGGANGVQQEALPEEGMYTVTVAVRISPATAAIKPTMTKVAAIWVDVPMPE